MYASLNRWVLSCDLNVEMKSDCLTKDKMMKKKGQDDHD